MRIASHFSVIASSSFKRLHRAAGLAATIISPAEPLHAAGCETCTLCKGCAHSQRDTPVRWLRSPGLLVVSHGPLAQHYLLIGSHSHYLSARPSF